MVRCGHGRTGNGAWLRPVLLAVAFIVAVGPGVPALAQGDDDSGLPPDTIYFPLAAPVWEKGSNWVRDEDTGNDDGIASPGERVEPRLIIRNLGDGLSKGVTVTLGISDSDVTVVTDTVSIGEFAAGDAVTISGFLIDIDAAATEHDVAATVTIQSANPDTDPEAGVTDPAVFSITISILNAEEPPFSRRSEWVFDGTLGNADGVASPGETVEPRVRVRNDGPGGAQNVTVALSTDSAIATLTSGTITHTTWPAGEARNNESSTLVIDASAAVGAQIDVRVSITADNLPIELQYTFTVVVGAPVVVFGQRSDWIFDGADGVASPGERVEPRLRLKHEGAADAVNVVTSVTTDDTIVTIVTGTVSHGTWPAGEARNNDGIVLDIGADATAHDVTLTYTVTADNASTATFTMTFSITTVAPAFSQRTFWARDKDTGNGDGDPNPGERLDFKARIRNDGPGIGENVVATLSTTDSNITIVTGTVSHATWPVGEARNNDGFVFDVGTGATNGDVTFTVTVTADLGGPWVFTSTVTVVEIPVALAERSFWGRDKTTGNADGLANPGERLQIKARLKHEGLVDAQNVVATLSSTDGKSTIVRASVTHATWTAGEARNNDGLTVEIVDGASGSAAFVLDVTADNGGPWQFTYSLAITPSAVMFEPRSAWARDKTTGNANGIFEAGEQLEIRARMQNVGQTDATNVVVTLSTTDSDVTVSSGTLNHATWSAGQAKSNVGFVVDLGAGYTASSMSFVVDVTSDGGGSWQFNYTIDTLIPAPAALAIPGDIDMDGSVDIKDILTVAAVYGEPATAYPAADVNGDAVLDIGDMVIVHGARTDIVAAVPRARQSRASLVEEWLREGRRLDDGSEVFEKGVPALERLLAFLRPAVTAVLPNYPNPFNPETWIPFDLADAGEVTIRVYNVAGQVVRRLDLGYVEPGQYRSRDAAAYWDGRNEFGEAVASGVYVYEIRSGGDRDMRRMVVRK